MRRYGKDVCDSSNNDSRELCGSGGRCNLKMNDDSSSSNDESGKLCNKSKRQKRGR